MRALDLRWKMVGFWRSPACLVLAAATGLVACGPGGTDPKGSGASTHSESGGDGAGADNGDGGTGAGGGGTGAANSGGSGATGPSLPSECEGSTPGARLLRRLTRRELINTQTEVFGQEVSGAASGLPGDAVDRIRLSNDSSILTMGQDAAQALLDRAEQISDQVTEPAALATSLPCAATNPDQTCALEFISKYGQALFRRPLQQAELDRYAGFHSGILAESDFNTALKWVLVGLIQSPHAVYRSELGEGGKLLPHEIASELAYNYSASPPSAELFAMALSGQLDDPEVRYQEAKKLLQSPKGEEVMRQFFEEWLGYKDVLTVSRSEVPENFESVRPKMVLETERFLEAVVFEKAGGLEELLTADFTYLDEELSAYYGFPGGSGDLRSGGGSEVQRGWGLGVFAQGSVTTTMASITITSPTRRGLLLLRRLYCEVPGAPQAINFDLTSDAVSGNTTRERLEQSHLAAPCQSCHKNFDPLGFGFEHIDHVGRWRDEEVTPNGSFPVDATATVASLGGLQVDGQEELMQGLSGDERVLSCISGTMARYVYGVTEPVELQELRLV